MQPLSPQITGQSDLKVLETNHTEIEKTSTESRQDGADRKVSARATPVVGSLNHPLLPMPPVRD